MKDNEEIRMDTNMFETCQNRIHEYDIVSFDIFDTLLMRNVTKPTDIFKLVELEYNRLHSLDLNFHDIRIKAEETARTNTLDEDILLDDIYHYVEQQLGDAAKLLKELEIETEKKYLVVNHEIFEMYEQVRELGKRIYLISDMYLPEHIISEILHMKGIKGYTKLFISGECKFTKATGSIYPYIRRKELLDGSEKWLHVGDNEHSDYKMPNRYGVESALYCQNQTKYTSQIKTIGDSIINAVQKNGLSKMKNQDYWYRFGYEVVGPLYIGLMFWLAKMIRGKDHIYFLARDGYMPYQLYNIMKEYDAELPDSKYLLASRRAYIYPSLPDADRGYAKFILTAHNSALGQKLTVGEILDNIGLESIAYIGKLSTLNLSIESVVDEKTLKSVDAFLDSIWDDICGVLRNEQKAVKIYLQTMGFDQYEKINIFDIGWRGSTHQALQQLIGKRVEGYYFGITENASEEIKDQSHGYAFDKGIPRKYRNEILEHIMMFELIFSAPHGSLIKFQANQERSVRPILQNVERNNKMYEIIERFQKGATDLFRQLMGFSDKNIMHLEVSKEFAFGAFSNLLHGYRASDLIQFLELSNSIGFGNSRDIKRYVSCYDVKYYLENRKHCELKASTNLWKDAIVIRDDQGRYFNKYEISKLYGLRKSIYNLRFGRYWNLFIKAVKNPRKAFRKLRNICLILLRVK